MKALTLIPEAATLVAFGEKTIECRTWKTPYRGKILFCAGSKRRAGCIRGRAFMVGDLVDIVPFEKKHLEAACMDEMPDGNYYAWIFENITLIYPFEQKGKLGLFEVDDELIKIIPDDVPDSEIKEIYEPLLK